MGFIRDNRLKYVARDTQTGLTLREFADFALRAQEAGWPESYVPTVQIQGGVPVFLEVRSVSPQEEK